MYNFVILTDNTVDMPVEWLNEHEVGYECLPCSMNGVVYDKKNPIDTKLFYRQMREGAMPTTSQMNPAMAEAMFEPYLQEKTFYILPFLPVCRGHATVPVWQQRN